MWGITKKPSVKNSDFKHDKISHLFNALSKVSIEMSKLEICFQQILYRPQDALCQKKRDQVWMVDESEFYPT